VLDEAPQHQEATQALGDLYARMDQPDRAAVYYGLLFDLLVEPKDESKALAFINRFLKAGEDSNRRNVSRDTRSCSKNKIIPTKPSSSTRKSRRAVRGGEPRGGCALLLERIAQLDPENLRDSFVLRKRPNASARMRSLYERFLRAGQLASASGASPTRCTCWAARTNSRRRSAASDCCMPKANLQAGNAVRAAALLETLCWLGK